MTSDPKNKKFLFDLHHFDKESEEAKKKKAPPAPSFSLQDMESARAEAFEKGKVEGTQQAKDSMTQRTEIVVQSIAGQLSVLDKQDHERIQHITDNSIVLIYKALAKAFPNLLTATSSDQIKLFLSDFFNETRVKSGFIVSVHPDMKDAISPYIEQFHQNITVQGDSSLTPNAAKIEWEKGTAHFDPDLLAQKLLDMIGENVTNKAELLDEPQKKPHNEETADITGGNDEDT